MESVRPGYSSSRSGESTCRRTIVHSSSGYKFFLLEYATLNLINKILSPRECSKI